MTAYEAAQKLQNAYYMAKQERENFFYVSHVLGSDWAAHRSSEFAGKHRQGEHNGKHHC